VSSLCLPGGPRPRAARAPARGVIFFFSLLTRGSNRAAQNTFTVPFGDGGSGFVVTLCPRECEDGMAVELTSAFGEDANVEQAKKLAGLCERVNTVLDHCTLERQAGDKKGFRAIALAPCERVDADQVPTLVKIALQQMVNLAGTLPPTVLFVNIGVLSPEDAAAKIAEHVHSANEGMPRVTRGVHQARKDGGDDDESKAGRLRRSISVFTPGEIPYADIAQSFEAGEKERGPPQQWMYGRVFKGAMNGQDVFLREMVVNPESKGRTDAFVRRVNYLASLDYPTLAQLLGVARKGDNLVLVSAAYSGDSLASLAARGEVATLPPSRRKQIALDVATAMNFLHAKGIRHTSLLPECVLLDGSRRAYVGDYGLADAETSAIFAANLSPEAMRLADAFAAPESFSSEDVQPGFPADVFAFGMLLYMLFAGGKRPFAEGGKPRALITSGKRPELPKDAPPALAALMKECLAADPAARPSFAAVVERLQQVKV
jgi:serine/threonine protein kinase